MQPSCFILGLLRVSKYSDIRGSVYKIEYGYTSLPKSLDRDLFFFFYLFLTETRSLKYFTWITAQMIISLIQIPLFLAG